MPFYLRPDGVDLGRHSFLTGWLFVVYSSLKPVALGFLPAALLILARTLSDPNPLRRANLGR